MLHSVMYLISNSDIRHSQRLPGGHAVHLENQISEESEENWQKIIVKLGNVLGNALSINFLKIIKAENFPVNISTILSSSFFRCPNGSVTALRHYCNCSRCYYFLFAHFHNNCTYMLLLLPKKEIIRNQRHHR